MRRITTAREQFDLLSPWMVTAAPTPKPMRRLSFHDTVMQIVAMADTTPWKPYIVPKDSPYSSNKQYLLEHPEHGSIGELEYRLTHNWAEPHAYIESLVVHPDHQRKGIGQALIERLNEDHPNHRINPGSTTTKGNAFTERLREIIPDAENKIVKNYRPSVMSPWNSDSWSKDQEERLKRENPKKKQEDDVAKCEQCGKAFPNNSLSEFCSDECWDKYHAEDGTLTHASRRFTAAPPAFNRAYADDGDFVGYERPQDFPSLLESGPKPPPPPKQKKEPQPKQLDFWDQVPRNKDTGEPRHFLTDEPRPQKVQLPKGESDPVPTDSGGWSKRKEKSQPTIHTSPNGNQYAEIGGEYVPIVNGEIPSVEKMKQPVLTRDDKQPQDPEWKNLDVNLSRFLVPEWLEKSVIDKYNASDEKTREAGSQWYDTANEYIHNLANKAGIDPHKVGAIVSALSPQTSWDQNMAAANYFIMNYDPNNPDALDDKMGGLGENLKRAKRIYEANDIDGYLAGLQNGNDAHKITNFYHNLMGDKNRVTIDSWMARALMGLTENGFGGGQDLAEKAVQKVLNWKGGYDTMAAAVQSAAKKLGITPRELQAIVWSHVVPTAGGYEELSPKEYAQRKRQRENYINNAPGDAKILPDYFHGPGWEAAPEPTYPNRVARFWQADKRPLYRGIQLNLDAKPGEVGYIPSVKLRKLLEYGMPLDSDSVVQSIVENGTGRYFTPHPSVAEDFASQAPDGLPSAVMEVDWDGGGRSPRPHDHLDNFPEAWDIPVGAYASDPLSEVRLQPGKSLGLKSLRVRDKSGDPYREVPLQGQYQIQTAGIQDNTYPQEWMDGVEQLARDTGGFSIHDNPGDGPESGYQIAIPGHERDDISTGQGWADYAREKNDVLRGNSLGTWLNSDDDKYYTEPSETIHDYDDAARATLDRNQWAMWDNGAFHIDPNTGEKIFLPQAEISRSDIAQQGPASAMGFTLAHKGIPLRPLAFNHQQQYRFWRG